jgi:hypothetical protein
MRALPLVEPVRQFTMGLVARDREPASPLVEALESLARKPDVARAFKRL